MQKPILFTKKGLSDKQKEYDLLLASRPDAVKDLAKAREMGDLSENGYYKSARMKLSQIDRDLRHLKYILKSARIKESESKEVIDLGVTVTLVSNEKTTTYEIVGTYEAIPSKGKISSSSPLGKALLGKRKGDTAVLTIGDKTTSFFILTIS